MVPNQVSAGVLPPKMLPERHGNGDPAPSQSGFGAVELSEVMTAPAACGTTPKNAADLCCWVVPVLPAIGRSQPTAPAALAAVPPDTESLLSPVSRVFASAGSTTCSHGASVTATAAPVGSVIDSIGLGGHHLPELASVAPTLASSSTLVGVTPRVNDACFWALVTSAIERSVGRPVRGSSNGVVASERMPSRTAMSTTSGTPVNSISFTNAVFGDWASASWRESRSA